MIDIVTYRWHEPWEIKYHGGANEKPGILYTEEQVRTTHRMIRKNMSLPYQIYHYSKGAKDQVEDDVIGCDFEDDYGGWFMLFSFMRREKPFLFVGLDNVILKDLASFVLYAQGHGLHTCQSVKWGSSYTGVVWVEDGPSYHRGFDTFFHSPDFVKDDWHDEKYIEQELDCGRFPYSWARSYKRQYLKGVDYSNAIIISFAGRPKYWDVKEDWVKEAIG